jgi:hypothetical protein
MFAKIDWLTWIVSVVGLKFAMVTWPKLGANTNVSWRAWTERFEVLSAIWLAAPYIGWAAIGEA